MKNVQLFLILSLCVVCGCDSQWRYRGVDYHDLRRIHKICSEAENQKDIQYYKARVATIASGTGRLDILKYIISTGDVSLDFSVSSNGLTPLQRGIENDHMEILKLLLENGADANKETTINSTPLIFAVRNGDVKKVKMLLEHGANINQISNDATALHVAVATGNSEIVKLLLSKKADVNIDAACGCRPIHIAAWCDRVEIAKMLLDSGGDPELLCDGFNALEIARSDKFKKLIRQNKTD